MNGSIPKSLGRLQELRILDLLQKDWEGVLSEDYFQNLSKLKVLSISSSKKSFVFNLSSDWVPPFSLIVIVITDYEFGPTFPKWLQTQTHLETIVLQNVSVSETIPNWLWKMSPRIHWLDVSDNQIRGTIPRSLVFPSKTWIYLSCNSLEGPFPLWPNVSYLNLANNSFSRTMPINIGQTMSRLIYLYLSSNLLNGSMPSSIGKINSLRILHLSNNHLSGKVHDHWMGEKIEAIDLSKNNLSGSFPASLCSLPNFVQLKLSKNRFFLGNFLFH